MTTRGVLCALGVGVLPTLAFILHDFVFQLPDNQHEASLGFFLTVGGLLLVWGLAGYLAARGTRTFPAAINAGVIAGVMSVVMLWLTFIALNTLFTDRMSYQPDRIRAFQASGYPNMKVYLQQQRGFGPFPFVICVAALAGGVGGVSRRGVRAPSVRSAGL